MARLTGLIWAAAAYNMSGYSTVTRNYLLGLEKIGFRVKLVEIGQGERYLDKEVIERLDRLQAADVGKCPALVIHSVPDFFDSVAFEHIPFKIACTIFETHGLPDHWVPILNSFDEVWVPSEFNKSSFASSGVDSQRIWVIPYGIHLQAYRSEAADSFPFPKKGFTFLYVCEVTCRKGLDLLLDAYTSEFSAADNVSLILKLSLPGRTEIKNEEAIAYLLQLYPNSNWLTKPYAPHLTVLTGSYNRKQLCYLYKSADLYISTDRANGWGVPCMEAMVLGTPAATIDWSGSTEFMNAENSLLIRPENELEPVDPRMITPPHFLYRNQMWAKVNVSTVRSTLRYAYENRLRLREIGQKGVETIRKNFSIEKIASKIADHVSTIEVVTNQCNGRLFRVAKKKQSLRLRFKRQIEIGAERIHERVKVLMRNILS